MAEQPANKPTAADDPTESPADHVQDPHATAAFSTDGADKPSRTSAEHADVTTDFDKSDQLSSNSTALASSLASNKPQATVAGYRLDKLLGEGGMGRVYRAVDPQGRAVAIKLLSARWATSEDALQRFKQEGYIASQINHPHCVFVHRVDDDRGVPFIAMELMSGRTLKDLIAQRGPLPYKEAVQLILQCTDGLSEAHSQGMIHRDIKPANCYLDDQSNVKIGDFGLARSLVDDSELTRTGAFLGTPLFASPEQLLGQPLDERSDIYSLSATLYYLLAGRAPFESPNAAQVIAKIASTDPPAFVQAGVEVPPALEKIVMRGLARDRNKRFASCHELRAALWPLIAPQAESPTLARRSLAAFIDLTLLSLLATICTLVITQFLPGVELGSRWLPLLNVGLNSLLAFTYFSLQEALLGFSMGKRLLRMRVVDQQTGSRPRLYQGALRAAAFLVLTNSIEFIWIAYFIDNPRQVPLAGWTSELIGWAILLGAWWLTGRRQMLHELLSGTALQMMPTPQRVVRSELTLPQWQAPQVAAPLVQSIGRFTISARLDTVDGDQWYVAHDASLDRQVWIHWLKEGQPAISDQSKRATSYICMRVIESGQQAGREWDAYLAPDGLPISACFNSLTVLPWPLARQLCHQVIEQYEHSSVQEPLASHGITHGVTRIAAEQLNGWRIWLSASGRITVCLPQLRSTTNAASGLLELLSEIALAALPLKHPQRRLLLTQQSRSSGRLPDPAELPPYRGLAFLERLSRRAIQPGQLKTELKQLDLIDQPVTSSMRMAHAITTAIVLFPILTLVWIMLCMGHVLQINELRKASRQLVTLAAVLEQPDRYPTALAALSEVERSAWLAPSEKSIVLTAATERHRQAQDIASYSNAFERLVLAQSGLPQEVLSKFPTAYTISLSGKSSESVKVIKPIEGVSVSTESAAEGFAQTIWSESEVLSKATPSLRIWQSGQLPAPDLPILGFIWVPAIVIWLWTSLTGGGFLQLFTGITIVRRDGCRTGLLRRAWRTLLWIAPMLIVAWLSYYFQELGPQWGWWSSRMRMLLAVLPLAYLISAVLWPQVCPHDRLSRTVAVPR